MKAIIHSFSITKGYGRLYLPNNLDHFWFTYREVMGAWIPKTGDEVNVTFVVNNGYTEINTITKE